MVQRWTLVDPLLNESYVFFYNPNAMTTPHAPRAFNIMATAPSASSAALGRVVELAKEPFEWSFSGRIKTQEQYEQFVRWSHKLNRLHLTDHLGRTWLIRVIAFNPNELRPTGNIAWRYDYDFKVLNYGAVT